MSAQENTGVIMDAPQIARELGVKPAVADKIVRWCAEKKGRFVKDPNIRKTWVYREDVEAWLRENTRSAA